MLDVAGAHSCWLSIAPVGTATASKPCPDEQASRRLETERILRGELGSVVLPVSNLDVITFWDVLEHLPDPRRTLEQACCRLAPGGLLLLTLPNFGSYQARHFGEDWYALSLPRHLYHFNAGEFEPALTAHRIPPSDPGTTRRTRKLSCP